MLVGQWSRMSRRGAARSGCPTGRAIGAGKRCRPQWCPCWSHARWVLGNESGPGVVAVRRPALRGLRLRGRVPPNGADEPREGAQTLVIPGPGLLSPKPPRKPLPAKICRVDIAVDRRGEPQTIPLEVRLRVRPLPGALEVFVRSRRSIPPAGAFLKDTLSLSNCGERLLSLVSGGMPWHSPHLVVAQRVQQSLP